MKKNIYFISLLFLTFGINAQTIHWPKSTDTTELKASKFTGGLNGWTTNGIYSTNPASINNTLWAWDINNINLRKGTYANPNATMIGKSPSASDGYALFNSDNLNSIGSSTSPHSSELVSPTMDLTGATNFSVLFSQYYRNYNTSCYVLLSNDNGVTWSDTIQVNEYIVSDESTSEKVIVKFKKSIGNNKNKIKFIFDGEDYFWAIDDVSIITTGFDLKINTNFYALPANRFTPKSQVEAIPFLSDFSNIGKKTSTNTKLKATVYNWGKQIFTTEKNLGSVKPDSVVENVLLPQLWTPSSKDTGTYYGSYKVLQDSIDEIKFNDSITFFTGITDTIFAKENGNNYSTVPSFNTGEKPSWKYGNSYKITKPGWYRFSATIGLDDPNQIKGNLIQAWLYKHLGDLDGDLQINEAERIRIASGEIRISNNQTAGSFIFKTALDPFDNPNFTCLQIDTGNYFLMSEYLATTITTNTMVLSSSISYDYEAVEFVTTLIGKPQYGSILGGFGDNPTDWSSLGFGRNFVPLVRLNIIPTSPRTQGCKDLVATENILTDDNKMSVFPNPVAFDNINVNIELAKISQNASLEIFDITGKYINGMKLTKVKNTNQSMDVSNFTNGSYFVKLTTEEGTKSVQFSVQR
jgi:hypothetical protein